MRIALLSNINVDPIVQLLNESKKVEVYQNQGYGNELGVMLNKNSPLYDFNPEQVFILPDLMEIIEHKLDIISAQNKINDYFITLVAAMSDNIIYHLADGFLYGAEVSVLSDPSIKEEIECLWLSTIKDLMENHNNVRLFSYHRLVEKVGIDNAFSAKMWYLGKIKHSRVFQRILSEEIIFASGLQAFIPKKVLLLDLDNTLWRGLAGNHEDSPVILSDDGVGLAYKNFQRIIKEIKNSGVILGIVSKNNESDALNIISNHPHMILRECDFAVWRINWKPKNENIAELAEELNVGLDSMVFIDDSPVERSLVKEILPMVTVPDFPQYPENLPSFMVDIYRCYFARAVITDEDKQKTKAYHANRQRLKLQQSTADFISYLKKLDTRLVRVSPIKHENRLKQLLNKTNQFNLMTNRFTDSAINALVVDSKREIFLYRVTDKFGDNGIVIAAVLSWGQEATIEDFVMSCRVMGRQIENAVLEDMEHAARSRGYKKIYGLYKKSEKNEPVANLYPMQHYSKVDAFVGDTQRYVLDLGKVTRREYYLIRESEEL